jgi:hypothetical protein
MIGVCSFPFKCPPAPSETALLLHDYLVRQGLRKNCRISLVIPYELPIPPSYGTSKELLKAFQEENIDFIPEMMVGSIDAKRKIAELSLYAMLLSRWQIWSGDSSPSCKLHDHNPYRTGRFILDLQEVDPRLES